MKMCANNFCADDVVSHKKKKLYQISHTLLTLACLLFYLLSNMKFMQMFEVYVEHVCFGGVCVFSGHVVHLVDHVCVYARDILLLFPFFFENIYIFECVCMCMCRRRQCCPIFKLYAYKTNNSNVLALGV